MLFAMVFGIIVANGVSFVFLIPFLLSCGLDSPRKVAFRSAMVLVLSTLLGAAIGGVFIGHEKYDAITHHTGLTMAGAIWLLWALMTWLIGSGTLRAVGRDE